MKNPKAALAAMCSEGVSIRAWSMWLAGALLIGLVPVERRDAVFIVLQFSTCTSAALILLLTRRYRGTPCASHARPDTTEAPTAFNVDATRHAEATSWGA